jgi:cytochrome c
MPPNEEGTLSADEVYALTAVLLYWNDIIRENDVIDAKSLPKIEMPNRNGFVPPPWPVWKPGVPRPFGSYP